MSKYSDRIGGIRRELKALESAVGKDTLSAEDALSIGQELDEMGRDLERLKGTVWRQPPFTKEDAAGVEKLHEALKETLKKSDPK
jgi:hypothetical protein